jgi:arsenite methyltransferase
MATTLPEPARASRRGHYGVDAPRVFAVFVAMLVVMLGVAIVTGRRPAWVGTALFACNVGTWWHATRRGKFIVWERLLDALALRGDERVLDVGCGRGAVLLAVARRLPHGRAVGVDVWSRADQSGNAAAATEANARAEGMADRIELHTGDMRALPLPDGGIDVVVSSLAIHNLPTAADRAQALAEALRVLRPGGRLCLADISATAEYVDALRTLGALDVRRTDLGWRMWWGGPFMRTWRVDARKAG